MRSSFALLVLVMLVGCGQEAVLETGGTGIEAPAATTVAQVDSPVQTPTVLPPLMLTPLPNVLPTTALLPTDLPTTTPLPTALPTATLPPTAVVPPPPPGGLPQARVAPPITDEVWLNSEPLALSDLSKEGKVTLVEFWTYSCYNCVNVLPHLQAWHETYADQGLTIIGVHYPEFKFERDVDNVRQALTDLKIKFPVSIDNDGTTWRAYGQRYWPTMHLIDKKGQIRYFRIGEGGYETTEQWIQYLLAEQQ